jgi:hypothetical protein
VPQSPDFAGADEALGAGSGTAGTDGCWPVLVGTGAAAAAGCDATGCGAAAAGVVDSGVLYAGVLVAGLVVVSYELWLVDGTAL